MGFFREITARLLRPSWLAFLGLLCTTCVTTKAEGEIAHELSAFEISQVETLASEITDTAPGEFTDEERRQLIQSLRDIARFIPRSVSKQDLEKQINVKRSALLDTLRELRVRSETTPTDSEKLKSLSATALRLMIEIDLTLASTEFDSPAAIQERESYMQNKNTRSVIWAGLALITAAKPVIELIGFSSKLGHAAAVATFEGDFQILRNAFATSSISTGVINAAWLIAASYFCAKHYKAKLEGRFAHKEGTTKMPFYVHQQGLAELEDSLADSFKTSLNSRFTYDVINAVRTVANLQTRDILAAASCQGYLKGAQF